MPIVLYHTPGSAPCRAVRLVAAAVGVELTLKEIDLFAGEQLKPEFVKINPQHVVPTIDDNGFYLWESRVICTYLVSKYGKDDSLYPKDVQKRAIVDQRLSFDLGTLYQSLADYYYPQIFAKQPADPAKHEKIGNAFGFLDKFLEGQKYVAGDHLTVADLSIVASVSTFEVFKYDFSQFKNVSAWFNRIKAEAPKYKETNEEGVEIFKQLVAKLGL